MRNAYEVSGDTATISIFRRGVELKCVIDAADLEVVADYRWSSLKGKSDCYYAMANLRHEHSASRGSVLMHRLITKAGHGIMVDHINHNTMDNRRQKLRLVSNGQNMQNLVRATRRSRSGVLNVFWYKNYQKWEAALLVNGKNIKLGYFNDIHEAEAAVKAARARLMPYSQEALSTTEATNEIRKM